MASRSDDGLDDLVELAMLAGLGVAAYFFLLKPAMARQQGQAVTNAVVDSTTADFNTAENAVRGGS